ncbi:membrane protein [Microbacterium phage DelaGarza]|nr:membrane protein [Microbacterium phage DelaGarza]
MVPLTPLQRLAAWFTPERRQALQVWFGSLAPLVILAGLATQEQTEQALIIVGAILQFAASALSVVNANWRDALGVLRGAIYALAATVAPALVLLGAFSEEFSTALLTALSLGLSSLSSLLAIFTVSQQTTAAERAERASLEEAAARLGVLPNDLTREQYRDGTA